MSRDDYIEVSERVVEFLARYPDGSLQTDPPTFTEIGGKAVVLMRAYAYRSPDDPRPGIGTAWELIPGQTAYTRGSEVMVCETSAWGRAIVALGISAHRGVASADEVRAARARQTAATAALQVAADIKPDDSAPATDKQRQLIARLFAKVMPTGTPETRTLMVQKLCGPTVTLPGLKRGQASWLINALTEWERTGEEPPTFHGSDTMGTLDAFVGGTDG